MPDSPAKKKWLKDNSKAISFRLMLKGDADIIEYLDCITAQERIHGEDPEELAFYKVLYSIISA